MEWILNNWVSLVRPTDLTRAMAVLQWPIEFGGESAWYRSLDVVDPSMYGDLAANYERARREFWQNYIFRRFNNAVNFTFELAIPLQTNLSIFGLPGSSGMTEEQREETAAAITGDISLMGRLLDAWQTLEACLQPTSDQARMARYRILYNTYWSRRQVLWSQSLQMQQAGYHVNSGGEASVHSCGWPTSAP